MGVVNYCRSIIIIYSTEELIGTTPFQRADSDEYYEEENGDPRSPSNQVSLADEYQEEQVKYTGTYWNILEYTEMYWDILYIDSINESILEYTEVY